MSSSKTATTSAPAPAFAYFSREQILAAMQRATKDVDFPALGAKIRIREITAQQRIDLSRLSDRGDENYDNDLYRAWMIRYSVIDPGTLETVFTDDDIPMLKDLHEADVIALCQEIASLSEVGPQALKSVDPAPDAE